MRAFLNDQMANPKLSGVIVDPSSATLSAVNQLEFFQDWLSDDKKEAVKKAVSSNELFLIQGPPGTGKTAVIAEITLSDSAARTQMRVYCSLPNQTLLSIMRFCRSQEPQARLFLRWSDSVVLRRLGKKANNGHLRSVRLLGVSKCCENANRYSRSCAKKEREARVAVKAIGNTMETVSVDTETIGELGN